VAGVTFGVDVGGTFTDVVLSDGEQLWRAKVPTTPGNLGDGVIAGCRLAAQHAETTVEELFPSTERFGLGTTAVTNTIASRTGRRVGLITTKGFEDLVPMGRAMRYPNAGWLLPPEPLIDPEWIVGVDERVDRDGSVLRELDPKDVVAAAQRLIDEHRVEALTVSFLWSFANTTNEDAAIEALKQAFPDIPVMGAGALLPVLREYERTTFALLNAYTSGSLGGVDSLVENLEGLGLPYPPLLVHSGGGSISAAESHAMPAALAESGPAAGVVASVALCEALSIKNAVTCDMGGTSFDMAIIADGHALRRTRGNLMGVWTALPRVDIESIGAGGGSIGWVDPLGMLKVGPQSAGAQPGPACYGRGGEEATVTDALVVLGYIDPDRFLGGTMKLDKGAARSACERLGEQLNKHADYVAWGIVAIAKASMVRALRAQLAARGFDPRDFTMISIGGCGGAFAADIAKELHMTRVLVPKLASVFSAYGSASANIRRERSRSVNLGLPADPADLQRVGDELAALVATDLAADGINAGHREITFEVDLRFARQKWELSIPWIGSFSPEDQEAQLARFYDAYGQRYGSNAMVSGAPVELVVIRAVGTGHTVQAALTKEQITSGAPAPVAERRSIDLGPDSSTEVDVLDGHALRPGHELHGPVVVDDVDTTVWIPEGVSARVDEYGTIDMEVPESWA
jgi:N-methylhydantoinase A